MLKKILKLDGAQELTKNELKKSKRRSDRTLR
jgi:hypothetical protein